MRTLSLCIGKSCVGMSIFDVNEKDILILHNVARVFEASSTKNNLTRRSKREARRLNRRKVYRVSKKLKRLIDGYNLTYTNDFSDFACTPYDTRLKGLSTKLNEKELVYALSSYLKHRGVDYLDELPSEDTGKIVDASKRYVCEIITDKLHTFETKKKSGSEFTSLDEIGALNGSTLFMRNDILKEIEALLNMQLKLNDNLDTDFKERFIKIFMEKRQYFEGPGDIINRTDYGIYRTEKDENGDYVTWSNLFENLVGNCSIYRDEKRAPVLSYTAQLFNFLNDINNMKVNDTKLTLEEKNTIYLDCISGKPMGESNIAKICGVKAPIITGVKKDSNNKMNIEKLQYFASIRKRLKNINPDIEIDGCSMDIIANILSLEGNKNLKISDMVQQLPNYSLSECEEIYDLICGITDTKNLSGLGWHSLSYKAMNEIIPDLWKTNKNQMQLFVEKSLFNMDLDRFKGHPIPIAAISDEILSPIVKRSFIQSCKMVEKAIKKFGPIDKIVIVNSRDLTSTDKEIEKQQKDNEKANKQAKDAIEKYATEHNIILKEQSGQSKKILMYRLWKEQNMKCLYSLNEISEKTLMNNILGKSDDLLTIDNIVPVSLSFDTGRNNKALVFAKEKRNKGKRTLYEYMPTETFDELSKLLKNLKTMSAKKKDYLLLTESIYKYDVIRNFIKKNLVDTRYASKVVQSTLK